MDGRQQGVHDRMHENIRVRMSQKSLIVRNFHAAQNEFAPLYEAVRIEAAADGNAARRKIGGGGEFYVGGIARA